MSQPPGPSSYENEMPRSWGLFTNRVDANQPSEAEKEAAEELIRTGWFDKYASTYDRNKARQDFQDGMRYGFKDRTYAVNWDVWRSEYKDRNYPPGSFDPRPGFPDSPPPQDPGVARSTNVFNRPNWMSNEEWESELDRQQRRDERELRRQMKQYGGSGRGGGQKPPPKARWYEPAAEKWYRRERRREYFKQERKRQREEEKRRKNEGNPE